MCKDFKTALYALAAWLILTFVVSFITLLLGGSEGASVVFYGMLILFIPYAIIVSIISLID